MVVAGREERGVVVSWIQSFSFARSKILEIGATAMCMYLTLLNCLLKHGEDGKFHVTYILLQLKIENKNKHTYVYS